jgi:hypothetical protein
LAACSNTAKFPVSQVAPGAEIKAKTRVDQDNNKVLTINAKNLENPSDIDPNSTEYVVWIETDELGLRNIGRLEKKDDHTAVFKAETPYEYREIVITAESRANVSQPAGKEIARVEIPEYMVAPIPDAPPPGDFESDTSMFESPGIQDPAIYESPSIQDPNIYESPGIQNPTIDESPGIQNPYDSLNYR